MDYRKVAKWLRAESMRFAVAAEALEGIDRGNENEEDEEEEQPTKHKISAAGRRAISRAMKARWAEKRKLDKRSGRVLNMRRAA